MSTQPAGYSHRSLVDKLGLKANFSVAFFNPPDTYFPLLGELPTGLTYASQTMIGRD